jgi:hypothetical protein
MLWNINGHDPFGRTYALVGTGGPVRKDNVLECLSDGKCVSKSLIMI